MNPEYIREQLDHFDLLPDKEREAQRESLLLELLSTVSGWSLNFYYCFREFEL